MPITQEYFGTTKTGTVVDRYTLSNDYLRVQMLTYGATIQRLYVSMGDGTQRDVVVGFTNLERYESDHPFIGCIIGRNANRIQKQITIEGKPYTLPTNEGDNQLHGGEGFHTKVWQAHIAEETLVMTYTSQAGEDGYPGTLDVKATFTLDHDKLRMQVTAVADAATIVNCTRHDYFNLDQPQSATIKNHFIKIAASQYTPLTPEMLPTGTIEQVKGSAYDLLERRRIGDYIEGYDLNYVLDKEAHTLALAASAWSPSEDLKMEVYCTQPGLQFFSARGVGVMQGKYGNTAAHGPGFCLESQYFPNAPAHTHFPTTVLKEGAIFKETMVYLFKST